MAAPVVAAWIGSAALSDGYTRTVNVALAKSECKRLRILVRRDAGRIFSARRFERWYELDTTWGHLCGRTEASYEALCSDLDHALWGKRRLLHREPSIAERDSRAVEIVDATIGFFMQNLDPSMAVAVADSRSEERHAETISLIKGQGQIDERLAELAPTVRKALQPLHERQDQQLIRLLEFVEFNAADPAAGLDALLAGSSPWLEELSASGLVVLGEFAASHELSDSASALFERAADAGADIGRNLGRAALFAANTAATDRVHQLAARGCTASGNSTFNRVVSAAIDGDNAAVIALVDATSASDDSLMAGLLALALYREERYGEAITVLRRAISVNPDLTGHTLLLARILGMRAAAGQSPTRAADLAEAMTWAIRVRDARRRWLGPSAEAVALACDVAAADFDSARVLRLGRLSPDGEATPPEATNDKVLHAIARAWLAFGQFDEANAAAVQIGDQFLQELVAAKACLLCQPPRPDEGKAHAERAWELVTEDNLRFDVQFTAAGLGMDPMPGEEWIAELSDDIQALLLAQRDQVLGRTDDAIARLRPYEGTSEQCAVLLAQILGERGSIDDAIEELRHVADQSSRPQLLIEAGDMLFRKGRMADARDLYLEMLASATLANPGRERTRERLLEVCQELQDWRQMERQAQALIAEAGPLQRYRWTLVGAIWNQGRKVDAWQAATGDEPLEPENAGTAALWAMLHCLFDPSRTTVIRSVDLLEQFIDDERVAGGIVQALLTLDTDEQPEPDEQERYSGALELFHERYPDNPLIQPMTIGENFDDLIAYMRASLEPTAALFEEFKTRVATGRAPYGLLSASQDRPYTAAVLHRAAGCLLIYPANRATADLERRDAAEARGRPVIVDPSALALASSTDGLWASIQSWLGPLSITDAAFLDVVASKAFCGRGDGTSVGWDIANERLVFAQTEPAVLAELRRRADEVEQYANALRRVSWSTQQAIEVSPDPSQRLDSDSRFWPWLSAVDYAKANEVALLSDDQWLRHFARINGVSTFGSAAILEVLRVEGLQAGDAVAATFDDWRSQFCVDLPGTEPLLEFARRTGFEPGPAAMGLSRPALWRDDFMDCLRCFDSICRGSQQVAPQQVPTWLYAAIKGATTDAPPLVATQLATPLLLQATAATSPSPESFAQLVAAARNALASSGAELGLDFVFRSLLTILGQASTPAASGYVLSLASKLSPEDRHAARLVVLGG